MPTSLSPTWGNRTGLAKAFNSLAADGGLMMTGLLARELARPLKDEKELRTIVEQARNTGPQPTHRTMEEAARVQRAAAQGPARNGGVDSSNCAALSMTEGGSPCGKCIETVRCDVDQSLCRPTQKLVASKKESFLN